MTAPGLGRVQFQIMQVLWERGRASAREITDAGGQALAIQCDVRDPEDVKRVVDATVERFGRLDVLVNNHGASFRAPVSQITPNGWDASLTCQSSNGQISTSSPAS